MDKKILGIILVSIGIFIAGCSNKQVNVPVVNNTNSEKSSNQTSNAIDKSSSNNNDTSNIGKKNSESRNEEIYRVNKSIFKEKNVKIYYPQIIGLGDESKEKAINELIEKGALAYVSNGVDEKLTAEIGCEISLTDNEFLSIKYSGVEYYAGAVHPNNVFYTTNIDVKNNRILKLDDIVVINQNLVDAFISGKYVPYVLTDDPKLEKEREAAIIEYINKLDDKDLLERLKKADYKDKMGTIPLTSTYLTKDAIGVSINVPHVMGDHVEYEINYDNIKSILNKFLAIPSR